MSGWVVLSEPSAQSWSAAWLFWGEPLQVVRQICVYTKPGSSNCSSLVIYAQTNPGRPQYCVSKCFIIREGLKQKRGPRTNKHHRPCSSEWTKTVFKKHTSSSNKHTHTHTFSLVFKHYLLKISIWKSWKYGCEWGVSAVVLCSARVRKLVTTWTRPAWVDKSIAIKVYKHTSQASPSLLIVGEKSEPAWLAPGGCWQNLSLISMLLL